MSMYRYVQKTCTICKPRHQCHYKGLSWEFENKVQKHEMKFGRQVIQLVDSPINFQHVDPLLTCASEEFSLVTIEQKRTCLVPSG
jgi:hypothetical protein